MRGELPVVQHLHVVLGRGRVFRQDIGDLLGVLAKILGHLVYTVFVQQISHLHMGYPGACANPKTQGRAVLSDWNKPGSKSYPSAALRHVLRPSRGVPRAGGAGELPLDAVRAPPGGGAFLDGSGSALRLLPAAGLPGQCAGGPRRRFWGAPGPSGFPLPFAASSRAGAAPPAAGGPFGPSHPAGRPGLHSARRPEAASLAHREAANPTSVRAAMAQELRPTAPPSSALVKGREIQGAFPASAK